MKANDFDEQFGEILSEASQEVHNMFAKYMTVATRFIVRSNEAQHHKAAAMGFIIHMLLASAASAAMSLRETITEKKDIDHDAFLEGAMKEGRNIKEQVFCGTTFGDKDKH